MIVLKMSLSNGLLMNASSNVKSVTLSLDFSKGSIIVETVGSLSAVLARQIKITYLGTLIQE